MNVWILTHRYDHTFTGVFRTKAAAIESLKSPKYVRSVTEDVQNEYCSHVTVKRRSGYEASYTLKVEWLGN